MSMNSPFFGICIHLITVKWCDMQIAHARVSSSEKGCLSMDILMQKTDGQKILDPDYQATLCSRLKEEMFLPLRMIITNRGPDTELVVANPVELSGKGRPRVFYDVTFALKILGICIFSVNSQSPLSNLYILDTLLADIVLLKLNNCSSTRRLKSEGTHCQIGSGKCTDFSWMRARIRRCQVPRLETVY